MSFQNSEPSMTNWCCSDCLMLLANGETPPDWTEEEIEKWLADIARIQGDAEVTLGMVREEHDCRSNFTISVKYAKWSWNWIPWKLRKVIIDEYEYLADNASDAMEQHDFDHSVIRFSRVSVTEHELQTEMDRGGECYCETRDFSWSSCGLCGSNLGGQRFAFTFWIPNESGKE